MRRAPVLLLCLAMCPWPLIADNGVAVGQPKVYDNRSLVIMLDQLNQRLSAMELLDQKPVAGAIGTQQGSESQDFSQGFNFSASDSATSSSGESATLPDLQTPPAFAPKFGESPDDLLADQVNLTYQIFNLRMLLERSLSDRLLNGHTRLQAVLGFNVSLDPPKDARDSVAVVEITVTSVANADGGTDPVSLVSLMPQEKTYNSSALSQHASSFGGSAVAGMFAMGYTARRRGQIFYLFRDADTISFDRMTGSRSYPMPDNSVQFGWEFRPVLGRRSVSPGLRQVFAVLSLPASDETGDLDPTKLNVTVRTYWRRYDHKTLTTYERGSRFSQLFTPNLPPLESREFNSILVPTTASVQNDLTPVVEHASWTALDDKNAVITATGRNFFSGTTVILGNKVHDGPATGLIFKSDQAIQVNATLTDLVSGDAVLNGRYGPSIPFELCIPASDNLRVCQKRGPGIFIESTDLTPQGASSYLLAATLRSSDPTNWDLTTSQLPPLDALPPIVAVNGLPVPDSPTLSDVLSLPGPGKGKGVKLEISVPASMLKSMDATVTVKFPFAGPGWSASSATYDRCNFKVARLGGEPKTLLAITGIYNCLGEKWRLQLDRLYTVSDFGPLRNPTPDLLTLEVDAKALSKYKSLLLLYDIPAPPPQKSTTISQIVPLTASEPAASTAPTVEPQLDPKQSATIVQSESVGVAFTGSGLSGVKTVTFEGKALETQAGNDGKELTVYLTRDVTSKPGTIDVLLHTASGKILAAPVHVTAAPVNPSHTKLKAKAAKPSDTKGANQS